MIISRRDLLATLLALLMLAPVSARMGRGGVAVATGAAPVLLYTDLVDVPNGVAPSAGLIPTGLTSANYQGESNHGGYLTIFGENFGSSANMGTSAGVQVSIGGCAPAQYISLVNAKPYAANSNMQPIQALGIQVGSACYQALTLGVAAALTVTVNGVSANTTDLFGNTFTIVPVEAPIFYLNPDTGSNSNAGTFASPMLTPQGFTGTVFTGILLQNTSVSAGKSNGVQAGTQIVFEGGTNTFPSDGSCMTSGPDGNRFIELFRITGADPTMTPTGGAKGVNTGYIEMIAYPGQSPVISQKGTCGGFIYGNDNARAFEANPYGKTGYATDIAISGLIVDVDAAVTNTTASPIYMNGRADNWRIVNNELTQPITAIDVKGGGVQGDGDGDFILGNYIHDMDCNSALEDHGLYLDTIEPGTVPIYFTNGTIAFNYVANSNGGSSIQFFSTLYNGNTDPYGNNGDVGDIVAYNWFDTSAKYGINLDTPAKQINIYDNIVRFAGKHAVRTNIFSSQQGAGGTELSIMNNSLYGLVTAGTSFDAIIDDEAAINSGFIEYVNNIIVLDYGRTDNGTTFYSLNSAPGTVWTFRNNIYFDACALNPSCAVTPKTTAPTGTGHSGELFGNPLWNSPFSSSTPTFFTIQATSPAIDAGTTSVHQTIPYDFLFKSQTSPLTDGAFIH